MAHAGTITIVAAAAAAIPGVRAARWLIASMEDSKEAQAQRYVALQAQPDLIRSTTLFHWWPQCLHKRHVPKRK